MERVAVIGCGSIGRRHLRNLQSLGYTDLLVVESNSAIRAQVTTHHNVLCYTTLDEALAQEPAVVIVATPSQTHSTVALAAAQRGCHLLIEKPLSHTLEGLDALCHVVRQQRLITLVGCNMRFHPGPAQVYHWLQAEQVGEVLGARFHTGSYLPRWRPQQDYRDSYSASPHWGGAVLDCIHELDLALWLLGEARLVASVTRPASVLGLQTDGLAELLLEHTSGAIASVHLNFVQRNYQRRIEIIGSTGTIIWDITLASVELYGADGILAQRVSQPAAWQINDMYVDEMAYFLRCVRQGEITTNPLETAMQTLAIALAAKRPV